MQENTIQESVPSGLGLDLLRCLLCKTIFQRQSGLRWLKLGLFVCSDDTKLTPAQSNKHTSMDKKKMKII